MDVAARQLVRAIRKKRSQEAFSRRLGYTSNPVADWEAGRRFPTAAEFVRAARLSNVDVDGAIARFRPEEAASFGEGDDAGVAAWLDALRGAQTVADVATRTEISRYAVARWLRGATRPRLPDFLLLIEALTGRLSDLVADWVDIAAVPALEAQHRERHASRTLAFDEPWTEAVTRVLETESYRASTEPANRYVSACLGVDVEVADRCLNRLVTAGVVREFERGRYQVAEPLLVDTRADPEGTRRLKAHWAALGLARAHAPRDGDLVSYNVVAVSRSDLDKIRDAHVRYFHEVRAIVAGSRGVEVAALVNIQLLSWSPPRESFPEGC